MNLQLTKKQTIYVSVTVMVIIIVTLLLQFLWIHPLKETRALKEETLAIEKKVLEALQEAPTPPSIAEQTSYALQKQVPVQPLYDQLFAELEEAKTVSGTIIENYEVVTSEDEENSELEDIENIGLSFQTKNELPAETSTSAHTLEKASMTVVVHADNYEEMTQFIESLEASERIIIVENLSYIDNDADYFSFELTFSGYYATGMEELIDESPRIDIEAPSEKTNPLEKNESR